MLRSAALALAATTAFVGLARAHDDDPKLLDRQPPHPGPGWMGSVPPVGTHAGSPQFATQLGFNSQGVTLLSWLTLGDLGGQSSGNDCWGYVAPSGREYAIIGTNSMTHWVEITDPQSPVIVAQHGGPDSLWHDMKVYEDHCYVVSEGGSGIQVFDMSQIDNGTVTSQGTVTFGGVTTATHNVVIDEDSGFLYRSGGSNHGLRIYDLNQSKSNPPFVGAWDAKYVHDAQVVTYPGGQQIAFCCSGLNGGFDFTGLTVVDVTNKNNPQILAEEFWPNPGYSHQIWISEDRQYAYLNDELDENGVFPTTTYVFDISPVGSTSLVGSFTNGSTAVGHNLYVLGTDVYEANYRSGLRIFDATNPTNPVETRWFDTYPADDADGFNGAWSVYPYFPSGVAIVSDLERGLFMLWPRDPDVSVTFANGAPPLLSPFGQDEPITITEAAPGDLVPGTEMLHYDAGAGLVSVPLTSLGGGNYEAGFPAIPCGSTVSFFVSAESTNGITWYDPPGAPAFAHTALAGASEISLFADDLETDQGWTSGAAGDDATTGIWTRVNPIGTAAQPEDDHTVSGTRCWVTGQGPVGGSLGDNDVDNGTTTLLTPVFDLSGMGDPIIRYWRWYSNTTGSVVDDVFRVDIDAGQGWTSVETIGVGDPEAAGGWFQVEFKVSDFVTPSSAVRLRFRASDLGSGSIVEAAIDDFEILDVECSDPPLTYCIGKVSSQLCLPSVSFTGFPSASSPAAFDISADMILNFKNGLMFYGFGAAALPFSGGTLCVQPPLRRTMIQNAGGTLPPTVDCSGTLAFDMNALIQSGADPLLVIGAQVHSQFWYRDTADPFGIGLSNGLSFTIEP